MSISTGNRHRDWALLLLIFLAGPSGLAQEQGFFDQHLQNRMVYNPAFAGDRDIPGFTFFTRNQWMGWEGSPSSHLLMAHTRLKNKKAGVAVSVAFDRMGPVNYSGFAGIYSYTLQVTDNSKLMMGMQVELRLQQIRISQLMLVDQGDLLFADDPGMKVQPNAGLGMVYQFGKTHVTFSVPRILNTALSPFEGETSRESRNSRVFYLGANSLFDINEDLGVVPSLVAALSHGTSPFIELSGMIYYQKRFGLGLLYRFNNTVGGMIHYTHKKKMVFGYAYDVSTGLFRYNTGTHELFLGYNFPFNRTKTISPRRF